MDFEPGRIVTLKSGGPPLTVVEALGDQVRCIWFAHADDRLHEALISAACLDQVSDEDAGEDFDDADDPAGKPGAQRR